MKCPWLPKSVPRQAEGAMETANCAPWAADMFHTRFSSWEPRVCTRGLRKNVRPTIVLNQLMIQRQFLPVSWAVRTSVSRDPSFAVTKSCPRVLSTIQTQHCASRSLSCPILAAQTHISTDTRTRTRTLSEHTCTHTSVYTQTETLIHTDTHIHTHTHIHTYTHTHIHTYTHTHRHKHKHIQTYTYMCAGVQVCSTAQHQQHTADMFMCVYAVVNCFQDTGVVSSPSFVVAVRSLPKGVSATPGVLQSYPRSPQ